MRVLVLGSGAREHALCWALHTSPHVTELFCLPGNGGTASLAINVPGDVMKGDVCALWAREHAIDLTIVGPDDPLANGIADIFHSYGLRCFGPTAAAARIESSKVWSKQFMLRHHIPTAAATIVTAETLAAAIANLQSSTMSFPVAIKADGLAAGKGVVIAESAAEAIAALREMIEHHRFGASGDSVLIESFLTGREVSVFAICDGKSYRMFGSACDHKRAFDNDAGPNTGGMGAYSPATWLTDAMLHEIELSIIAPTIDGMRADGVPFTGFLFAGIMITPTGPQAIEFNARFGDPEAQEILPLLASPDLFDLCFAATEGALSSLPPLQWRDGSACGVVIATADYPASGAKGLSITGLADLDKDILVFHAGTRLMEDGSLETNGGRIMTVVGFGPSLAVARERAYANIGRIAFTGARYRIDIGSKGL